MCRGNFTFILILLVYFSYPNQAEAQNNGKARRSIAQVKKLAEANENYKIKSGWMLGGGYIIWNEEMKLSQAGSETTGFANYGGYSVSAERFWMSDHWLHGVNLSYGMGKAVSGGFAGTPTFTDGINRAWMSLGTSFSSYRRLNSIFMVGFGLLARYRNADWDPKDSTVTVSAGSKIQGAGQIHLRWRVSPHFTFIQTYAALDFKNSTLWNWSAHYEF